jgi:hypothetical protein
MIARRFRRAVHLDVELGGVMAVAKAQALVGGEGAGASDGDDVPTARRILIWLQWVSMTRIVPEGP